MVKKINQWKDPWFYYKFISALCILGVLFGVYSFQMITQTWSRPLDYPFSYLLFQGHFLSFFTYQSNFIVGIWFMISAIYHNKPNKVADSQSFRMAVTCYISVTCFVFIAIIAPALLFTSEKFNIVVALGAVFFHIITPALMIVYNFTHVTPWKMTDKKYYHKSFWLYLIYPWVYTVYLLGRIAVYGTVPALKDMPIELVYPYLPLLPDHNIHNALLDSPTAGVLIASFFLVAHACFVLFNVLYFYSMRKISKNHKKSSKVKKKSK